MRYEIKEGNPADCPKRPCVIHAYENNELMATYNGFDNPRRGTWALYPKKRYALPDGAKFEKITKSERDVHLPRPKMELKPAPAAKPVTNAAPKAKAWWTLPDPEGQMKLV